MIETDVEEQTEEESRRYYIDTSWFEENGLSLADLLRDRMCEPCQAKLGTEVEDRQPVFDKKSGRMTFKVTRVPYGANPIRVIRDCCSRQRNYIHPDMPTLEAVFRIYLANGNQPMPLEHVREQLAEWCPGGGCQWLTLPLETLDRLVQNDRYYGLRQHLVSSAA